MLLMLFFVVLAIFPGQIAPYNPIGEDLYRPRSAPSRATPARHDAYGEDIFSQLVWGTRLSLVIALAVGALATGLAVLVGVSAGYLGGATDGFLSLVTDVILVLPIFPLIIVIAAYEKNAGLLTLVVVLGVLGWSYGARQLRSQTLSLRRRDFLESARVRGERKSYVILHEILPTMTSLIVATFLGAGDLRRPHRGGTAVHRARRPEQPELGDDALLGAEQRGALRRHAALGDRSRRLHRAARCVLRAPQLRLRRDQQPGAACAEARTGTVPEGRAAAARACGIVDAADQPVLQGRGPQRRLRDRQRARSSPSTTSTSSLRAASSSRSSASRVAGSRRCSTRSRGCSARRYRARSSAAAFSSRAATWFCSRSASCAASAGATSRS